MVFVRCGTELLLGIYGMKNFVDERKAKIELGRIQFSAGVIVDGIESPGFCSILAM